MIDNQLTDEIKKIPGPILILGASGFIGANLLRMTALIRQDVYGTSTKITAWRLESRPKNQITCVDLRTRHQIQTLLDNIKPNIVFDCIAYGAYSFEESLEKIYHTNILNKAILLDELIKRNICYIHAGSSSEYGENSSAPHENNMLTPNSHYAVTKSAVSNLIYFAGKHHGLRCANLRLYSVYGPLEDAARLIPQLIINSFAGKLPPLVDGEISRDFIFVDDVCEAFIATANNLSSKAYGESFNIGTGCKTTISELTNLTKELFNITDLPNFSSMPSRRWDTQNWYANPAKAKESLGWQARTTLRLGLLKTSEWLRSAVDQEQYIKNSKQNVVAAPRGVSAIVACYKDAQAIPIMVERLIAVFAKCAIDYEIILVNDCSPDDSEVIITELSKQNPHIIGITHARNFGSQAAFRSGMEIASKQACVLLDGDLQDPPELIEQFIAKWREGYDVVYGIRVKREAPWFMQVAYKLFYRLFDWFSSVPIPHDAGDFSLIDQRVVKCLLTCNERDLFLRGLRAYVGFKQTGIQYIRPKRMFGETTNSLLKNIDWAKKGIFSFSRTPLNMLTASGILLTASTLILAVFQIAIHLLIPGIAPKGITTVMLLIMFFGSFSVLGISILGEYIAKIFEEVKARPHYIRKHLIRDGSTFKDD